MNTAGLAQGTAIGRILRGAWRTTPPVPDFGEAELTGVEGPLMASGAAGLVWQRIAASPLAGTATGERIAEAHRLYLLRGGVRTGYLERILDLLADAQVLPLIFKGWDSARRYPDAGMRPYGDIDFLVLGTDDAAARRVVQACPPELRIDLDHPAEVLGSSVEEIFERAHEVEVGGRPVLVPSEEDRLRMLAIHFLKSSGWRPSNLCDIAMASEVLPEAFSPDRCRTADTAVASWVGVAFDLAATLLGADVPPDLRTPTPRWVRDAVLGAWSVAYPTRWRRLDELPGPRHPRAMGAGLARRWPHPVAATIAVHDPITTRPPTGAQVRWLASRSVRYLRKQTGRRAP